MKEVLQRCIGNVSRKGFFTGGLRGSSAALYLASREEPLLAVVPSEHKADILKNDILFYQQWFRQSTVEVLPGPVDQGSTGDHARVLHQHEQIAKIIVSSDVVLRDMIGDHEGALAVVVKKSEAIEREELLDRLRKLGYRETGMVSGQGEFSPRHFIVDVFPTTYDLPVRIEFFGDEVESIRVFHIDTQRSGSEQEECVLYPAEHIEIRDGIPILDFFSGRRKIFELESALAGMREDVRRENLSFVTTGEAPGPFQSFSGTGIPVLERRSFEELPSVLASGKERIMMVLPSQNQAKRVSEVFAREGLHVPVLDLRDADSHPGRISVSKGTLSEGIFVKGLMFLTQKEVFGKELVVAKPVMEEGRKFLNNFEDIREGDFVVHADHGVGTFRGLSRHGSEGSAIEVALVEYAENSILYVPLYHIDRLHKFRAEEGFVPVLDRIGGKTWNRKKRKAKRKIDTMVERLIELYAQRESSKSYAVSTDTEVHQEFYSFFPFHETEDQERASGEIAADLESDMPMDRVLCGDVGFGKTEVAMRAAFKVVYDNRQVAVIVPTTILCEQHYRNFRERFSAFPVSIDFLSRFKTAAQIRATIERTKKGEVDILIGTSSLLRKDLSFSSLGLLIIDEEHRFGVAQKEKIKELRHGVDCLMMSATPIPRTLQMALSGVRTMSVIETPPEERLAVHSVIARFDNDLITTAVARETARDGQVFFVAPRIRDLEQLYERLVKLLPGVKIAMAHGRMKAKELEDIMIGFMNREHDMLLSTSIIASGIDIPSANTLIVFRADQFGLADLYQLKGRVGRGNLRGHAYFLVSAAEAMTEQGSRRLRAIEELSYLGAGLKLAMKDLEIRGAGTLFGYEQSGHIHEIGFDMYLDLIRKEVERVKGTGRPEDPEAEISVYFDVLIPDDYVSDETVRLSLYRRMASVGDGDALSDLRLELKDRFGPLPGSTGRLLDLVELRLIARQCRVKRLEINPSVATIDFRDDRRIHMEKVFGLAGTYSGLKYREGGFEVSVKMDEPDRVLRTLRDILLSIKKDQ